MVVLKVTSFQSNDTVLALLQSVDVYKRQALGADAPHRQTQKVVWLIGFADGRRKVKDALYYSVFKERAEAIEKAPSLSMPKS